MDIGKQVWAIASKADALWVRWVATVYLKNQDFFEIQVKNNMSWQWKQLLKARDQLRQGYQNGVWKGCANGIYTIQSGYN